MDLIPTMAMVVVFGEFFSGGFVGFVGGGGGGFYGFCSLWKGWVFFTVVVMGFFAVVVVVGFLWQRWR